MGCRVWWRLKGRRGRGGEHLLCVRALHLHIWRIWVSGWRSSGEGVLMVEYVSLGFVWPHIFLVWERMNDRQTALKSGHVEILNTQLQLLVTLLWLTIGTDLQSGRWHVTTCAPSDPFFPSECAEDTTPFTLDLNIFPAPHGRSPFVSPSIYIRHPLSSPALTFKSRDRNA